MVETKRFQKSLTSGGSSSWYEVMSGLTPYLVQGTVIAPTFWSLKNQKAKSTCLSVSDVLTGVAVRVGFMSTAGTYI